VFYGKEKTLDFILVTGFLVAGLIVIFTPTRTLMRNDYGVGKLWYKLEKNEDESQKSL
jgi:hypothetical protein